MHGITGEFLTPRSGHAPSLCTIALALGRTPRWRGQTVSFFPVLAHCFLTSELIVRTFHIAHQMRPALHLHALLHDAAEAIVGDIPSTWKTPADTAREALIQAAIYDSLDIGHLWPLTPDIDDMVREADLLARRAEATALGHESTTDRGPGHIPPICAESEPELEFAVVAARRLAAASLRYPAWLEAHGERQAEYVRQVLTLIENVNQGKAVAAC